MTTRRYAAYGWVTLAFNIGVILWGAYVRASGSGAGCGSHWPLCNGEIIPTVPVAATLVEFLHRLTSGAALVLVAGLVVGARRWFPVGHRVRRAAWVALGFTISEALLGAGLVLLGLVADNSSAARAVALALHLLNTFLLLAALTLTCWWASGGAPVRLQGQGVVGWSIGGALVGVLLLGMSGSIAALGDTLFPALSLAEGLRQDFDGSAHILVQLRLIHPLLAGAVGLHLFLLSALVQQRRAAPATVWLARSMIVLLLLQGIAGGLVVLLLAPVWMQVVHLLMADAVWVLLVLLSAATLARPVPAQTPQQDSGRREFAPEPFTRVASD